MTQDSEEGRVDGIRFDPDGTIVIIMDGYRRKLRVPKFGEFKKLKKAVIDLQRDVLVSAGIDPAEAATDPMELTAQIRKSIGVDKEDEWSDATVEKTAEVVRLVVEVLGESGGPLPADVDEWPTWLVVTDTNLARMVAHWRTVPLGRG